MAQAKQDFPPSFEQSPSACLDLWPIWCSREKVLQGGLSGCTMAQRLSRSLLDAAPGP